MPDLRPDPSDVISKTFNRARVRGPIEVLGLMSVRVMEGVWSDDTLFFFTRPAGGEPVAKDDLVFRRASVDDAVLYARSIGTDSASTFKKRLSEETRCFLVERGKTIVHASWVTTASAWTRELRCYVVPPKGDAYIYESFTRADTRGLGIYPFALVNIAAEMGGEGAANLWVATEDDNVASKKSIAKAGFTEAFEISYRRRVGRLVRGKPSGPKSAIATSFLSAVPQK